MAVVFGCLFSEILSLTKDEEDEFAEFSGCYSQNVSNDFITDLKCYVY